MTKIAILKMCLLMRNGIEIWVEEDRAKHIAEDWLRNPSKSVITVNGNYINTVDIMGIFTPQSLDEFHRQKRGQWQCKYNNWHERDTLCECGRQAPSRFEFAPSPEEERSKRAALEKVRRELEEKGIVKKNNPVAKAME